MPLEERLIAEGADWIAEQLIEEFGGFIAPEVIEAIMLFEAELREQHADPQMDHASMITYLLVRLEEDGAPIGTYGGITRDLLNEILMWEDEFLGLAGQPRTVR